MLDLDFTIRRPWYDRCEEVIEAAQRVMELKSACLSHPRILVDHTDGRVNPSIFKTSCDNPWLSIGGYIMGHRSIKVYGLNLQDEAISLIAERTEDGKLILNK